MGLLRACWVGGGGRAPPRTGDSGLRGAVCDELSAKVATLPPHPALCWEGRTLGLTPQDRLEVWSREDLRPPGRQGSVGSGASSCSSVRGSPTLQTLPAPESVGRVGPGQRVPTALTCLWGGMLHIRRARLTP